MSAALSFEQKLSLLNSAVHSEMDYSQYNSSSVLDNTNCFSHAIGSTLSFIELYRIGAICGEKPVCEQYFSTEELIYLFQKDYSTLDLKVEKSFLGYYLKASQYQIALYIIIYADKQIHDFHFLRNDSHGWSEKRRYSRPIIFLKFPEYNYFPWNFLGIFKVTK